MASSFVPNEDDRSPRTEDKNSSESKEIRIITDEPLTSAPDLDIYSKTLSSIIVNSLPRFTVGIYGGWGTGKTSLMKMIQKCLEEYKNDTIITIWFDAWRYEYEEFSALVPLVRTIFLHLEEYIKEMEFEENSKRYAIKNLAKGFKKLGEAIIDNSKVGAEIGYSGAKTSFETDVGKAKDQYKSGGYFFKNQGRVYFYKHASDYVKDELQKARDMVIENLRLVIFIDDLDRCIPDRALEILESIKTFFDIEGIIFVIGIDPSTIDPIIKTKYGEDSKIDGMKYLQKIVQLPYTIPLWNASRLSDTITGMIKKTQLPKNVIDKVFEPKMQGLITKATELNPRDVKRFINTIVMYPEIYGQEIDDIEKIIVIQAFYFHGDKWIEFLKLLIPYDQRIAFLTHFILWLEKESTIFSNLYNLDKSLQYDKNLEKDDYIYRSLKDKSLLDIYKTLINIGDNALFAFLKVSKKALLRIDKIERFLIMSDQIGLTNRVGKFLDIDSVKQLDLLRNRQITEFNKYIEQGIPIHLPFVELSNSDLHKISLTGSLLFRSNLSKADLTEADLSKANLSKANLTEAKLYRAYSSKADLYKANLSEAKLSKAYLYKTDLSEAKLSKADLTEADLSEADLTEAKLTDGDLSEADLSEADLRRADLSRADLSKANLYGANLTGANLYRADLTGANLRRADLTAADLTGANLRRADLTGANLRRADLTVAKLLKTVIINSASSDVIVDMYTDSANAIIDNRDFLELLRKKGSVNIPNEIRNKQELREELLKRSFGQELIDYYLSVSQLPNN